MSKSKVDWNGTESLVATAAAAEPSPGKSRLTFLLSDEVAERLRDAVYWERQTLSEFVEHAITETIKSLERKRSEPFRKRPRPLLVGRPRG